MTPFLHAFTLTTGKIKAMPPHVEVFSSQQAQPLLNDLPLRNQHHQLATIVHVYAVMPAFPYRITPLLEIAGPAAARTFLRAGDDLVFVQLNRETHELHRVWLIAGDRMRRQRFAQHPKQVLDLAHRCVGTPTHLLTRVVQRLLKGSA